MLWAAAVVGAFPPAGAAWKPVTGSWDTPALSADPSSWEHSAVQEPQILEHDAGQLRLYYRGAGWGAPSGVGVATSRDGGKSWTKHAGNPVWVGGDAVSADCAGQPWVYRRAPGGEYYLFTTNNHPPRTCLATSSDGLSWRNGSGTSGSIVPLPPSGRLFGNRAVWEEGSGAWRMLQEVLTSAGVWEIFLYSGSGPTAWEVQNGGEPLRDLQVHAGSMYGGCHIATVDGRYVPIDPASGLYTIWYHAGAHGNLPTDIYRATSRDLVRWNVSGPVVRHRGSGSFAFDQVADPSPLVSSGVAYLAFDGDDNRAGAKTHAAIGLASAPPTKRSV